MLALVETSAEGVRFVRVLPITHSPPVRAHHAVELPPLVKRRLGLDDHRSWVVLTESNRFAWPGPDLRPPRVHTADGYYGPLPPALFAEIRAKFVALARSGEHLPVVRTE